MPLSTIAGRLLVLALLMLPRPAHTADEITPEHRAAAQKTALAVGATRQIELVLPLIMGQMERTFAQTSPDLTDELESVFEVLRERFKARMDTFANRIADAYARKFTIDELKTISAFYSSTAGKKFVRRTRDLEKSNARIGREFSEKLGQELNTAVRTEMKKRGHSL